MINENNQAYIYSQVHLIVQTEPPMSHHLLCFGNYGVRARVSFKELNFGIIYCIPEKISKQMNLNLMRKKDITNILVLELISVFTCNNFLRRIEKIYIYELR